MITSFNKYENKVNEESLPSWVDEKILKPTGEIFKEVVKPLLSIPGTEGDKELDENVKKLFNTPIANIPVYIYAQLMDILDDDRIDELKLETPLTKDSSMLDVASNYYVFNIANILDSVNKVEASFSSEGIDQETAKILNATPITVGTIIRNSIINWYASNEVSTKLIESLNKAVKNPHKANYLTSLIVNITYLFIILPTLFFYEQENFCKTYFSFLIILYLLIYFFLEKKNFQKK